MGRPRCTVMVLGMTTSVSTRAPGQLPAGAGPLPPRPENSGWGGMSTLLSATMPAVATAASAGRKFIRATVSWPSNTCTPVSRTVCQPSFSATRSYTA
ncbi:hypothetical protein H6B15_12275 [Gemmiger formicilis]|uniref:hypothetical protein n=1 Tax=Gemmiger formicilis TaxID=745368 RepID=UPI00195DC5A9|nr:hypothetical protein [Gemmiger formicilis]MBM6717431.1 hypothetical protein [Gemmiger formicilis]